MVEALKTLAGRVRQQLSKQMQRLSRTEKEMPVSHQHLNKGSGRLGQPLHSRVAPYFAISPANRMPDIVSELKL